MQYKRSASIRSVVFFALLIIYLLIILSIHSVASAAEYTVMLNKRFGIKAVDIDKPRTGKYVELYANTCMSAAMANAITFSTGFTLKDGIKLYAEFAKMTDYRAASSLELWDGMMDTLPKVKGYYRYSNYDFMGYIPDWDYTESITGMIDAGFVVLVIFKESDDQNHVVTVYGYTIGGGGLVLHYCDSDDGVTAIRHGIAVFQPSKKRTIFQNSNGLFREVVGYTAIRVNKPIIDRQGGK